MRRLDRSAVDGRGSRGGSSQASSPEAAATLVPMSHSLSSAIRGVLAVLLGLVAVALAALSVALCWFQ